MKFHVLVKQDEDGAFTSEVPELPGCISQGSTRDAALENTKDAIFGYITSLQKHRGADPVSHS